NRASVPGHDEHQGGGRQDNRGNGQEGRKSRGDVEDMGFGGREHVAVRIQRQQRDDRRSRDRKGKRDARGERTRGLACDFGLWKMAKMESLSDNGLTLTYKTEGDAITMTTPNGQSFTAKMDGTEAPYKGDPGITSVSIKKLGPNSMEETDKRDGKVITVA